MLLSCRVEWIALKYCLVIEREIKKTYLHNTYTDISCDIHSLVMSNTIKYVMVIQSSILNFSRMCLEVGGGGLAPGRMRVARDGITDTRSDIQL